MTTSPSPIAAWHDALNRRDVSAMSALLADDCVFHSPVLHKPQQGKALTQFYLTAAASVLANDSFTYVREVVGERDAVLEFTAEVDGVHINGVDMIRWNDQGLIVDFKVMVRPMKAIELLKGLMAAMLTKMSGG